MKYKNDFLFLYGNIFKANGLVQIFDGAGNLRGVQSKAGDLAEPRRTIQASWPKFYFRFAQIAFR